MIGVVVWSNKGREQAVIWCDDQAALAYLVGRKHFSTNHDWPQPGDLVELDDEVAGGMRYARAVKPLGETPAVRINKVLASTVSRGASNLQVVRGANRQGAEPRHTRRAAG